MKRVLIVSLLVWFGLGCRTTEIQAPSSVIISPQPPQTPPLPPGLEALRSSMMPSRTLTARSATVTESASSMMAAAVAPEPTIPYVAKMTSFTMTNIQAKLVHITFEMATSSFGIAYSDDMINWVNVGEANWTNAAAENPFVEPGVTEHSVWITDTAWMSVHTPGVSTNAWKLHIYDLIVPATHPRRFYKVYPLGPVTGLP